MTRQRKSQGGGTGGHRVPSLACGCHEKHPILCGELDKFVCHGQARTASDGNRERFRVRVQGVCCQAGVEMGRACILRSRPTPPRQRLSGYYSTNYQQQQRKQCNTPAVRFPEKTKGLDGNGAHKNLSIRGTPPNPAAVAPPESIYPEGKRAREDEKGRSRAAGWHVRWRLRHGRWAQGAARARGCAGRGTRCAPLGRGLW